VLGIVVAAGGVVAGVASIVDRSGGSVKLPDFFPILRLEVVTYPPDACPLCRKGIPVAKPGSRNLQ
jgi:orotate phosphoribosyltransferase